MWVHFIIFQLFSLFEIFYNKIFEKVRNRREEIKLAKMSITDATRGQLMDSLYPSLYLLCLKFSTIKS